MTTLWGEQGPLKEEELSSLEREFFTEHHGSKIQQVLKTSGPTLSLSFQGSATMGYYLDHLVNKAAELKALSLPERMGLTRTVALAMQVAAHERVEVEVDIKQEQVCYMLVFESSQDWESRDFLNQLLAIPHLACAKYLPQKHAAQHALLFCLQPQNEGPRFVHVLPASQGSATSRSPFQKQWLTKNQIDYEDTHQERRVNAIPQALLAMVVHRFLRGASSVDEIIGFYQTHHDPLLEVNLSQRELIKKLVADQLLLEQLGKKLQDYSESSFAAYLKEEIQHWFERFLEHLKLKDREALLTALATERFDQSTLDFGENKFFDDQGQLSLHYHRGKSLARKIYEALHIFLPSEKEAAPQDFDLVWEKIQEEFPKAFFKRSVLKKLWDEHKRGEFLNTAASQYLWGELCTQVNSLQEHLFDYAEREGELLENLEQGLKEFFSKRLAEFSSSQDYEALMAFFQNQLEAPLALLFESSHGFESTSAERKLLSEVFTGHELPAPYQGQEASEGSEVPEDLERLKQALKLKDEIIKKAKEGLVRLEVAKHKEIEQLQQKIDYLKNLTMEVEEDDEDEEERQEEDVDDLSVGREEYQVQQQKVNELNQDLSQLQQELERKDSQIENLQAQLSEVNKKLTELQGKDKEEGREVGELRTKLNMAEMKLAKAMKQLEKEKGKASGGAGAGKMDSATKQKLNQLEAINRTLRTDLAKAKKQATEAKRDANLLKAEKTALENKLGPKRKSG